MDQINPLNESFVHAPRYDGRIIRYIGGYGRNGERRIDFYTNPCVWTDKEGKRTH